MKRVLILGAVLLSGAGVLTTARAEGLAPPGPTRPVSLRDIEPRTPIHTADIPLTITEPGSYYLVEDITWPGVDDAITIGADDVTIDLMGFTLRLGGVPGGASGIVSAGGQNLVVRNGTIADCYPSGIDIGGSALIQNVLVENSWLFGIHAGSESMILDSRVTHSGVGIDVGDNSVIRGCALRFNERGIYAGRSVRISDTIVTGASIFGISAGEHCTVSECTVDGSAQWAIRVSPNSRVENCLVRGFRDQTLAISVAGGSFVLANNCNGARIYVNGSGNRVEGNNVADSLEYGIEVEGTGNLIIRNSVSNSFSDDYKIAPGNDVGPIGSAATSASPWANIVY